MSMRANASTSAAPPMSFFMRIMPLAGLMSRPPVSKHTPLPTSVTSGLPRLAPAHVDESRFAGAALAHLIDEWIVLPQQILADHDPAFGLVLQREALDGFTQLSGPEIVRGRIDEIARLGERFAGEPHVFEIGACGRHQRRHFRRGSCDNA